jgi:tetratricopeptide (TPR) repeat protein
VSYLGRWPQKEVYAAEAALVYASLGNRAMEAECLSLVAHARINSGQTEAGLEAGRQALAIVQEMENPWGQVTTTIHLSQGLLDAGRYEEALSLTDQAANLAYTHRLAPILPYILIRLGTAQRALRRLEAACATHQAALTADEALRARSFTEMIHAELCVDYGLMANWPAAYDHARQALALRKPDILYTGLTRWYETEALLRGGDSELARTDAARFGGLVEDARYGNNNPRFRLPYLRCLAVLAEWKKDVAQALIYLEAAQRLAEEVDLPGEQWSILVQLAGWHESQGNREQAQQLRSKAADIINRLAGQIKDEQLKLEFLAGFK